MNDEYIYLTNCTEIPLSKVQFLNDMIDKGKEITQKTFFKYVNRKKVQSMLGYSRTFPIRYDNHVSYYKSKFKGKPCYYLCWSSIEYIFTKGE